eukprot:scaffold1706_cov116-Cylindrotheca_fusiformis.AAC.17
MLILVTTQRFRKEILFWSWYFLAAVSTIRCAALPFHMSLAATASHELALLSVEGARASEQV